MKTKTNTMKTMIALFAVLSVTLVLSIGAAPAMAGVPHLETSEVMKVMQAPSQLDKVHGILDSLIPSGVDSDAAEVPAPDQPIIPDGGDWEPYFPEDDEDDAAPPEETEDAGDEVVDDVEDEASDEADDEAAEETVEEPGDEVCEEEVDEEAGDETIAEEQAECGDEAEDEVMEDEEPQSEEPQGDDDDTVGLPFTGGNSTPWLIAGAAIILAGASLFFRRHNRNENR